MDTVKTIYKTLAECATFEVSSCKYVVIGRHYFTRDASSSSYYLVTRYVFAGKGHFCYRGRLIFDWNRAFNERKLFSHLVTAVSRRGLTAVIQFSRECKSWNGCRSERGAEKQYRPTFLVDGVLCVCVGESDCGYVFLPLSVYAEQLEKQMERYDTYDRENFRLID